MTLPNKDIGIFYYKERHPPPAKDVDGVVICNRREEWISETLLSRRRFSRFVQNSDAF